MASWTYSDWTTMRDTSQRLTAAGFTQLNLHIQEVTNAVTASVQSNGNSRDASTLQLYLDRLFQQQKSELSTGRVHTKVHRLSFGTLS